MALDNGNMRAFVDEVLPPTTHHVLPHGDRIQMGSTSPPAPNGVRKKGRVDQHLLPPFESTFSQHFALRANSHIRTTAQILPSVTQRLTNTGQNDHNRIELGYQRPVMQPLQEAHPEAILHDIQVETSRIGTRTGLLDSDSNFMEDVDWEGWEWAPEGMPFMSN